MKVTHFPESRERRFKNVKVSPNIETLENIRSVVENAVVTHGIKLVAITGPWDGAILTVLDDVAVAVAAVDTTPSDVLKKMAAECDATIVDTIPAETDLLIIDSALQGRAFKDAAAALKMGIAHVIIHNTNPQLSSIPVEMKTALEGATLLSKNGYKFSASSCISQDGGRRGLEYGFNASIEKVAAVIAPVVETEIFPDASEPDIANAPTVGEEGETGETGHPGVPGVDGIPAVDPNTTPTADASSVDVPVADKTVDPIVDSPVVKIVKAVKKKAPKKKSK